MNADEVFVIEAGALKSRAYLSWDRSKDATITHHQNFYSEQETEALLITMLWHKYENEIIMHVGC